MRPTHLVLFAWPSGRLEHGLDGASDAAKDFAQSPPYGRPILCVLSSCMMADKIASSNRLSLMYNIATPSARHVALALTVLRVVVGIVFLAHGYQKFFVYGLAGATGAFTQMGIPAPALSAAAVAIVEVFGGLALIFGAFTRIAALLLAVEMFGAIVLVHLRAGFFLPQGFEYALTLLAASIALALAGGGAYAADETLGARSAGDRLPANPRL
ncbi:MAG: hypothetical protein NVS4B3_24940 [Gemmatimonadaceae bacterium]